jgi:hypothetical protein
MLHFHLLPFDRLMDRPFGVIFLLPQLGQFFFRTIFYHSCTVDLSRALII